MRKNTALVLLLLLFLISCKEDVINIPKVGDLPFDFTEARIELINGGVSNTAYIRINELGYIFCDSLRISYNGFSKEYKFTGSISSDSSISVNITPLDSLSNDKIKLTAKQTGSMTSGLLLYCNNSQNCEYLEIGHITGIFTNRFEGFYYSPLFYGEYYIYPLYNIRNEKK